MNIFCIYNYIFIYTFIYLYIFFYENFFPNINIMYETKYILREHEIILFYFIYLFCLVINITNLTCVCIDNYQVISIR